MRMFQTILACSITALSVAVFSSDGIADPRSAAHNKMCMAVFTSNRAAIEEMAGAGNTAGIKSLFASRYCPEFGVRITRPAGTGGKCRIHIHCEPTIDPIGISCEITFGRAIAVPGGALPN